MRKKVILFLIVIIVFSFYSYRFYDLRFKNNAYYLEEYEKISTKYVYDIKEERGRILDRNGKVLIDNKKINVITFRLINNPDTTYLINLASKLMNILDLTEEASSDELKKYYLLTESTDYLLTVNEFGKSASKDELLKYCKVDLDSMVERIKSLI